MRVNVKIEGIEELQKRLRDITEAVRDEIIGEALLAAGAVIRDEAKSRAPVRTGTLSRSIVAEPGDKKKPSVRVGITDDGYYGRFLELGTRQRTNQKGARLGAITATPFLAPAVSAKRDEAGRVAGEVIRRRLDDV